MIKKLLFFILFSPAFLIAQITDSLAFQLGTDLENHLLEGQLEQTLSLIDEDVFLDDILIPDLGDGSVKAFNMGFSGAVFDSFFGNIIKEIQKGTSYNFINYYPDEAGNYYLVFRFFGDTGISYHEYVIADFEGSPKAYDVYVYMSGEFLSQTMKRVYRSTLKEIVKNEELKFDDAKNLIAFKKIQEAKAYFQKGKYDACLEIYNSIDTTVRYEKTFLINGLLLCPLGYEEQYNEYYEIYAKKYPGDISLFLLSIDYLISKKDFQGTQNTLDSLAYYTNDDFIDYMKGNIYYLEGDLKKSEEFYLKALENYPTFLDVYDSLFVVYAEQNNYPRAVFMLEEMRSKFQLKKKEIVQFVKAEYPGLSESESFSEWK